MLNVRKFPDQFTLAECVSCAPEDEVPQGWERMSEVDFSRWQREQVAAGWKPAEVAPVPEIPQIIRSAQLRQWLIDADLMQVVEAAFENPEAWPSEKTRKKAQARWEYEVNIHRDDPLVLGLAASLGMTSAQIDAAFIAANEIP